MSKPTRTRKQDVEKSALEAYLETHGISQEEFANRFAPKVTQGLVWQWLTWLRNPKKGTRVTAERAVEIESITAGEVKRGDLRPDLYPVEKAAA